MTAGGVRSSIPAAAPHDGVPSWSSGGLAGVVGVAALGVVAVSVAPLVPVVGPSDAGVAPGSRLAALTVALCLLGVLGSVGWAARRRRPGVVVGLVVGAGTVSAGLVALDAQLFVRALDANRIELLRPTTAAELQPAVGAWLVLVGHGLLVLAALAAAALGRTVAQEPEADVPLATRIGAARSAALAISATLLAVSLLLPPLRSADPVVIVPAVVQSSPALVLGAVGVALAALLLVALALVSTSSGWALGALGGVGLAAASAELPRLLGALVEPDIGPGPGAVLGSAAAVVLAVTALLLGRRGDPGAVRSRDADEPDVRGTQSPLPGPGALLRLAGAAGLLAGGLAVVAARTPVLTVADPVVVADAPVIVQTRVLLLGAVLLVAACAGMVAGLGAAARPVVAVVWLVIPLGAGAVLQAVLLAAQVSGVGWGVGALLTVGAVVAAVGCAVLTGLAGAVERDEIDLTDTTGTVELPPRERVLLGVGTVSAVLGLLLPLYSGPRYAPPGVLHALGGWGWDTWSLVVVATGVGVAVAVASRARPARGAALLAGVTVVLSVHLASWPLTWGRVADASVGVGVGATTVGLVALGAGAVLLARR